MSTVVRKNQDPLLIPATECHRLKDKLNAAGGIGAACLTVSVGGLTGATGYVSMEFDSAPTDAVVDAVLAAYATPSGLVESTYVDSLWSTVVPSPGPGSYFDITVFELEEGRVAMAAFVIGVCTGTAADANVGSWALSFAARRNTGDSVVVPHLPRLAQAEGGLKFRVKVDGPSTVRVQAKRPGTSTVKVCITKSEIVRDQL